MENRREDSLRSIPGVDKVLEKLVEKGYAATSGIKHLVRKRINCWREKLKYNEEKYRDLSQEELTQLILDDLERTSAPQLVRVINATGIILHTNLGRAPLSEKTREDLFCKNSLYCNLEFDLLQGKRDSRQERVQELLCAVTMSDSALVVNNNAAAVLLILDTLAREGEVIVSRGELVEIGGSFRLPEIMKKGGAFLREVGTTNRTRCKDYEQAIADNTSLIMKVHPSNYRIKGYTEEASVSELVQLGRKYNLPLIYDLGSGALWPVRGEPKPWDLLQEGVDLLSFSGDKLFGGPQAGIILGREDYIKKLQSNNLARALRIDKLTLGALETTLRHYLLGQEDNIPVFQMYNMKKEDLQVRTEEFKKKLQKAGFKPGVKIIQGEGYTGGGALPEEILPGPALAIEGDHKNLLDLQYRLRQGDPAVVCSLQQGELRINLRTVLPEEDDLLFQQLLKA